MYWAGSDILLVEYPELRAEIEELQEYFDNLGLKAGDIIELENVSAKTHLSESILRNLFETLVDRGILHKIFKLKCPKNDVTLELQEVPYGYPVKIYCDYCDEVHILSIADTVDAYKLTNGDNVHNRIRVERNELPTDSLNDQEKRETPTIGIITALINEFEAFKVMLENSESYYYKGQRSDSAHYTLGKYLQWMAKNIV